MLYFVFLVGYNVAQVLLLPLILSYFLWRKIKKKSVFGNLRQRLGFVPSSAKGQRIVWIHAVSVGETLSTEFLIKKIADAGKFKSYLTYGTLGAHKVSAQLKSDYSSFIPYDFFASMLLCFRHIKPDALIVIEAERWPNLFLIARLLGVPCYVLNGRITQKASSNWDITHWFIRSLYRHVKHIYAQSEFDTELFQKIGIAKTKVSTIGNIKAANVLLKQTAVTPIAVDHNYFIFMGGSIHPTEDTICLEAFQAVKLHHSEAKLLLVPRHFHWLADLKKNIMQTGRSFIIIEKKMSPDDIFKLFHDYDIVVVAVLGLMFPLYQFASLFFLGGTFVPVGGHNLLEPAVWGNASLVGPHYANTASIAHALQSAGALLIIQTPQDLINTVESLAGDRQRLTAMGRNARTWLEGEATQVEARVDEILKTIIR